MRRKSSILINLRPPTIFHLLLRRRLSLGLAHLHLDALARTQNLALQVETAPLLRIIHVEQPLEPISDLFQVCLSAAVRRFNVEDATGLVEGQARGCVRVGGRHVPLLGLDSIFGSGGCLLVGLCEGAAEHTGSRDDDLGDDSMGL